MPPSGPLHFIGPAMSIVDYVCRSFLRSSFGIYFPRQQSAAWSKMKAAREVPLCDVLFEALDALRSEKKNTHGNSSDL